MDSKPVRENGNETLRDLIDLKAITEPDVVFLISPDTGSRLTYRGLQEQSRLLFDQLRQAGLEPGDKVAFLMDNGLFTAQLFLGAIYGGFVSVPLNVRAGASQLSYTLDHCDAKVVFVEEQYSSLTKEVLAGVRHPVKVISGSVDRFVGEGVLAAQIAPTTVPAAEDVALLMYTSGSTGQPKAAVHTHRTILAQARNSVLSHQLTSADRSLLVLPLYHINAECVTLVPTLLSGGSVVVPHHFVVGQFWDWLDENRCTWSALVPTIISQLLDWKDPRADSRAAAFKRIRFLRSSSAPLSPSLHREFIDKFKLPLIQAMGCSEGGNVFSNPVPPGTNKIGSPGLPWGFETRIVDQQGLDLPQGEPGEILLRGPAMTSSYYKEPVTTAAAFDAEGWFHTGDLAYRDEDGYFFVVGRSKELIIKGGTNIAPKQIDEVIESHPAVLEAAAVGVPDRYVGEDLVAFAVLRTGMSCDEKELLGFCENHLGSFKTPTRIFFVQDLPKGPSGKVQRLRLVDEASRLVGANTGSSTRNLETPAADVDGARKGAPAIDLDFDKIIAEVWSTLLGKPQIDAQSNFFALGGHSLLAIQALSRLRDKVPVMLSLSDFFKNATVAQLAALVRKKLANAPAQATADRGRSPEDSQPIPVRDRNEPCPLSLAQERLWFLEQFNPGVPLYNEAEAVRLKGKLEVTLLERALNVVVARHEILRSTIRVTNDKPRVVVHENLPLELKRIDLRDLSVAQRDSEIERLLVEEPRRLYHLEAEPGIRATVIQLAAEEYVFFVMMHHIICDRLSLGVLWVELGKVYEGLLRGQPAQLPALPIQYGDFAIWQRQRIEAADFVEDISFWKENLGGAPQLLDLPTDRARPPLVSYRGIKKQYRLGPALANRVRELGRREKTSLFNVFTAAWNTLLHRYSGQDDILVGIPIADRDRPELQPMIGFFVDTQVLRTNLAGDPTFQELLARVQQGVVDVYSHKSLPFAQVVEAVKPERNLSYSPLFQVMLNWRDRNAQLQFIGLPDLAVEPLLAQSHTSKFDLTVFLTDAVEDMLLEVEYSTDLFNDDRIERMIGHLRALLDGAVTNPEKRLSDLPLLTEAELSQLVLGWNDTSVDYPHDKCVHELFEAQVEKTPDAVAVTFGDQQLTYRELNNRANQLARHLQKLGIVPDTLAGICVERSLEMVIGVLGILKAGGAYVPLDPEYPKERLAFMMEDSNVPVLLTQAHLVGGIPPNNAKIVRLDADWPAITAESAASLDSGVKPRHLAYMIYTSGSTGRPKGGAMGHEALSNLIQWQRERPGLIPDSRARTLQFAPLSFDVSFQEIFSTLHSGGTLVLITEEVRRDFIALLRFLNEHSVERLFLPFVALHHLAETACREHLIPRHLREVITAGEQLHVTSSIRTLFEQLGHCALENQYGPTESHVVTSYTLSGPPAEWMQLPPIGRPIANAQIYILDKHLRPTPIGMPGELYIGGIVLARGYHNRPDLTAQKFIADPFSKRPGARLYKTGDSARYLSDGNIEFLGRLDNQVKIRGFRLELGEIEEVLNQHPLVQSSVVVVREDTPGDKRLIAYLVSRKGSTTPSQFRESLRGKLPDYMLPSVFVILEKLPLTPNGKVDRKALPAPGAERPELNANYAAPSNPTEKILAEVWAQSLALEKVGIHDNFFDLGGHSLLMVQVQARVSEKLKTKVSVVEMFQYPTVSSLARHLSRPSSATGGSDRLQKAQERTRRRKEALDGQRQTKGNLA